MKLRTLFLSILLFLIAGTLYAETKKNIIEITPTKKIIHVSALELPENTPLIDILRLVPELMVRGDLLFYDFDVQFDGKSVGSGRDVFLVQTSLVEIEKVEISTSSVSTQENNAKSGVINIVPRKPEDGFGGQAFIGVSTQFDAGSKADLTYNNGKLEVIGFGSAEFYSADRMETYTRTIPGLTSIGEEDTKEKYLQETARVNLKYHFTNKDLLKVWFLESIGSDRSKTLDYRTKIHDKSAEMGEGWAWTETSCDSVTNLSQNGNGFIMTEYEHEFGKNNKLNAFVGYELNTNLKNDLYSIPHSLKSNLKYKFPLFQNERSYMTLQAGVNTTLNLKSTNSNKINSFFASPFAEVEFRSPVWQFNAAARYQFYERYVGYYGEDPHMSKQHNLVGNANVICNVAPNHSLRLILSRNIKNPSDDIIFPGLVYDSGKRQWIMGNEYLEPAKLNEVELTYLYNMNKGGHSLTINAGAGYIYADNLPATVNGYVHRDSSIIYYTSFVNDGVSNIVTVDASIIYSFGRFAIALCGNLYGKTIERVLDKDFCTYFNLSLNPMVGLGRGWTLSGRFLYNSPVEYLQAQKGSSFYTQIEINKKYKNWTFFSRFNDILGYKTIDTTNSRNEVMIKESSLYERFVGIGAVYSFGSWSKR